jgi:hypothetical protein
MEMTTEKSTSQTSAAAQPLDLLSRLYREIGISAVAAALEASARKQQKQNQKNKDIPAVLRNDEAA